MKPTEEPPAYSQQQTQVFLVKFTFPVILHTFIIFSSYVGLSAEPEAVLFDLSIHGPVTDARMNFFCHCNFRRIYQCCF